MSHIFISHAHQDKNEPWFTALIDQLTGLELPLWMDTQIEGGQKWRKEIKAAIKKAHIAVLVLSPNFLKSKYIKKFELPCIHHQHKKNQLIIYPILGVSCPYTHKYPWLGKFQRGELHARPLKNLEKENTLDDHLSKIAIDLDQKMESYHKNQTPVKPKVIQSQNATTCQQVIQKSILPLLTNRTNQIYFMNDSIHHYQPGKPLIWFVHGYVKQGHEQLITCIENYYWEKLLNPSPTLRSKIKAYPLRHLPYPYDLNKWHQPIAKDLMNKLQIPLKDNQFDPLYIFNEINRSCNHRPTLLYDSITSSDWRKDGKHTIFQRFLDFWTQWPTSTYETPLIVCLLIKYEPQDDAIPKWKLWAKNPNQSIKTFIQDPKKMKLIPELEDVTQAEIERWYEEYKTHIHHHCHNWDIDQCIQDIFKHKNQLPMESLTSKLKQLF